MNPVSTTLISPGTIGAGQVHERFWLLCLFEQFQSSDHGGALSVTITRWPQGSSHHMGCDQHPREGHFLQARAEGPDADNHRGDAALLQQSGYVSHGHVAHGSDRHQQRRIYLPFLKQPDPPWSRLIQQPPL